MTVERRHDPELRSFARARPSIFDRAQLDGVELRRKKLDSMVFKDRGAPLEPLDRLSHRLIWVGFPIFTVALVLGAVWTARLGENLDRPEYALAAVTWIAFSTGYSRYRCQKPRKLRTRTCTLGSVNLPRRLALRS